MEEHKDLLIAFLNEALLDLNPDGSARRIEDVTYGDRESSPLYRDAKLPRFDVIATAEDGRVFHIEVQVAKDRYFLERSLYYAAMTYFLQMEKGDEYSVLTPVIFVGLLDFEVFPSAFKNEDEDYHSRPPCPQPHTDRSPAFPAGLRGPSDTGTAQLNSRRSLMRAALPLSLRR